MTGKEERRLFAGLAMMNLQNVFLRDRGFERLKQIREKRYPDAKCAEEVVACLAVKQADELIAALEKDPRDLKSMSVTTGETGP